MSVSRGAPNSMSENRLISSALFYTPSGFFSSALSFAAGPILFSLLFLFMAPLCYGGPESPDRSNLHAPAPAVVAEQTASSGVGTITLLTNEEFFNALLPAIETAKEEIVVSVFLFKSSEYRSNRARTVLDKLVAAAGRGVDVKVLLERDRKPTGVYSENLKSAERLRAGGVKVFFDDINRTTHTKVVVIDGKDVFLGSHNLTHSALRHNNEASLRVFSPLLAKELLTYIENLK